MSCRSELPGLGGVQKELVQRGGGLLAVSVDSPEQSKRVVESQQLSFKILSDPGARVIREYGLLFKGMGLVDTGIAIPAQFLLDRDRRILWRHVATRVPDRADPEDVLQAVHKHWPAR